MTPAPARAREIIAEAIRRALNQPHDQRWTVERQAGDYISALAKAGGVISFPEQGEAGWTVERIAGLVDRFLAWPLPKSVCADFIASTPGADNRTGTNLLTADEARSMLEYLLAPSSQIRTALPLWGLHEAELAKHRAARQTPTPETGAEFAHRIAFRTAGTEADSRDDKTDWHWIALNREHVINESNRVIGLLSNGLRKAGIDLASVLFPERADSRAAFDKWWAENMRKLVGIWGEYFRSAPDAERLLKALDQFEANTGRGNNVRHARDDYNRIQDPAGLIPDAEPVFLLRGQDHLAVRALYAYAVAAEQAGLWEIGRLTREQAQRMLEWPKHKMPDLAT